jgi:hypothetical protein
LDDIQGDVLVANREQRLLISASFNFGKES